MPQTTLSRAFTLSGPSLHSGRRSTVTVGPAQADHGWRISIDGSETAAMTWRNRVPSLLSTSIAVPGGGAVRTVEHLMAALAAFGVDNAVVDVRGEELPIFDGSATPWCEAIASAGLASLEGPPRRAIRILKPFQIARAGGFLRGEPASGYSVDVTYDLPPGWPFMRWRGPVERDTFVRDLAASRSFGRLKWRRMLGLPPAPRRQPPGDVVLNRRDPTLIEAEPQAIWDRLDAQRAARQGRRAPLLRGARPWRAAFIVGPYVLGGRRFPDEAVRHVALDLIGDLALAGHRFIGRIVAHVPSHEKNYAFVASLMEEPSAWEWA